jgi:pimeloyl-ACP methyl ester carboxylesterase
VENHRTYGAAPYTVAVVHGGPGAAGEMAPVARELARGRGIVEPLQTATSLEGQVEELRMTLESSTAPPVVLIGYSWGAWAELHRRGAVSRPRPQTAPRRERSL